MHPRELELPAPGDRIEGWRIISRVGVGGMATVLSAEVSSSPGERRALKFLHAHLAEEPAMIEMILDEAQLGVRLRHPGIVRVEGARSWRGMPYLVMELVDGVTLSAALRSLSHLGMGVSVELAVAIALRLLRALAFAHAHTDERGQLRSIVHRDVSPSNVIISRTGDVKLFDFGVAKDPALALDSGVGFKGKLRYAAPEQLLAQPVDARTDLYAVGVLLWELLTGARLVDGDDPVSLFSAMLRLAPRAPSTVDPRTPRALDAVVLRCLAQRREHRPESAAELTRMLVDALPDGDPRTERALLASLAGLGSRGAGSVPREAVRVLDPRVRAAADEACSERDDDAPTVVDDFVRRLAVTDLESR